MMANLIALQSAINSSAWSSCSQRLGSISSSSSSVVPPHIGRTAIQSHYTEPGLSYLQFRRGQPSVPVLKAARDSSDWIDDSFGSNGTETEDGNAVNP